MSQSDLELKVGAKQPFVSSVVTWNWLVVDANVSRPPEQAIVVPKVDKYLVLLSRNISL